MFGTIYFGESYFGGVVVVIVPTVYASGSSGSLIAANGQSSRTIYGNGASSPSVYGGGVSE